MKVKGIKCEWVDLGAEDVTYIVDVRFRPSDTLVTSIYRQQFSVKRGDYQLHHEYLHYDYISRTIRRLQEEIAEIEKAP